MPLELIVGRANAGKTGVAYGTIRSALKDGLSPVLVVPSLPDIERARSEFAREPSLGLSILTFDDLIRTQWEKVGDGRQIVAEATKSLLLISSLQAVGLDVGYRRAGAVVTEGLSEHLGLAWRESLWDALPGSLEDALAAHARALESAGLLLPAEAAHLIAEAGVPGDGPWVFHRFDDFTSSQLAMVRAHARRGHVLATLTWEADFAPTAAVDHLVEELAADAITVLHENAYNTADELEAFADLMSTGRTAIEPTGAVVFGLAQGREAQAALVVDLVAEAQSAGVSLDRIVVALRSPERHYRALRRAFADAGIPVDFDVRVPLTQTSLGSAVVEALRAAAQADTASLVAALRTPYSGLDAEEARRREVQARGEGLSRGMSAALVSGTALAALFDALNRLGRDDAAWEALARAVCAMYAAARAADVSADDQHAVDAKAHQAIVAVLEAARDAGSARDLASLLMVLEEQSVDVGGHSTGGVQVRPVTRLRGQRFDDVIIAGLNAGEFPAAPDESCLPGSRLHDIVVRAGGIGVHDRGADFEHLLFYETLTRATRRVALVGLDADDEGQTLGLSAFWEQAADVYAADREKHGDIPELRTAAIGRAPSEQGRGRERILAAARAQDEADARVAAALRRTASRPSRLSAASIGDLEVVSASQIETYLSCPYRWFYDRAVGARELESDFGAQDEGSIAHELLKRTYEAMRTAGHRRITPANLPEAMARLDEALAQHERGCARDDLYARVGTRMARGWVARILEQDAEDGSGFVPHAFEHSFGFEGEPIDLGGFGLRGVIDRIDADESGHALITDYKRQVKAGLDGAGMLEKGVVQVLLYMAAFARTSDLRPVGGIYRGMKQNQVRGVVVADCDAAPRLDRKRAGVTGEALEGLVAQAIELSAAAVEGMRCGHIAPKPHDKDACAFCGARRVCGEAL